MLEPQQQGFAKLVTMIEALEVGMLTTEDKNGHLRSRPMATQKVEDGVLWFFSAKDTPKILEVQKDSEVNVSYADPSNQVYISKAVVPVFSRCLARQGGFGILMRSSPKRPKQSRTCRVCPGNFTPSPSQIRT